jgi:hypothetical protein
MTAYTGICKLAKNDKEDDEGGNPTPEFVRVDNFVSEQRYDECCRGDYENTRKAWHVRVHRVYQLGTDDSVNTRPANTCKDVEHSNYIYITIVNTRKRSKLDDALILTP